MLLGLGADILLSFAWGPVLRTYLYGLSPLDPLAYGMVIALLAGAGMLATFIPARRACRSIRQRRCARTEGAGTRGAAYPPSCPAVALAKAEASATSGCSMRRQRIPHPPIPAVCRAHHRRRANDLGSSSRDDFTRKKNAERLRKFLTGFWRVTVLCSEPRTGVARETVMRRSGRGSRSTQTRRERGASILGPAASCDRRNCHATQVV
jgi:hypothetical protein